MKLAEFYKQLFQEAIKVYEPVWEEEESAMFGYRWHKNNYPLLEQFQIKDLHPGHPVLMYSLVLPETYLQTTIYEEIRRYRSPFELSIVLLNRKLWLNAALQTDKLQDSVMGYLNHARAELMNILDCVIRIPNEEDVLPLYATKVEI
ncbi:hypothetical protein D7Z26_20745 [Cohnella endophytica]|uniref:Uncharacterized protein n=1 Tax=Cohnella endophytica TaxID=2419778 RepID=A0A494XJH2_9BACL|nr:hypothetical protein [Cohnella endophytica]RKP48806.1 hypothetical protein D7Z26_20745 [Cohnella endophytica]